MQSIHSTAKVKATPVGTPVPDFSVAGERVWTRSPFQLSAQKGVPAVLHFWATWCGPCLVELPEIIMLAKENPDFQVITVAEDESWAHLEKFFARYPELSALQKHTVLLLDPRSEIANVFHSNKFPETFLINSQGIIDNKFVGAQPWTSAEMAPYLGRLRAP